MSSTAQGRKRPAPASTTDPELALLPLERWAEPRTPVVVERRDRQGRAHVRFPSGARLAVPDHLLQPVPPGFAATEGNPPR